ncbi:DNA-binding transcriptional regulator, MerR family [Clostridium collagenovorans DSM 3089]|uniref:DNA-binding transcriptional regulator, MerR family n=1 Tax=Clostridium collagenovorans DSM 3089 TaxID=1121306 RepID=A0A1M5XGA5_9CLOT|nr:MerR family transcriptional regulator [Clostridium collagenovorans]SHH98534.1 DNA-binding transcriptional regulator, MerR family [Clostridium collagenovorans DSM 3089]
MLIKEVCSLTKLTKKAIEYYEEHKLIEAKILNNGYRDFNENDIETLKKISMLRKLGIGVEDIKVVLQENKFDSLNKIILKRELGIQREKEKQKLLNKLTSGSDWAEIKEGIMVIEKNETILEKLMDSFPGYYGRFICLHFSRFLNEPILTKEQEDAYDDIVNFLDNVPALQFPEELQEFLIENTKHINTINIREMNESTKKSIENPDKFLKENKEMLEEYLKYKQSEEYKQSPVYKIQELMKEFNSTSGYYDIFIPSMKRLSRGYAEYYKQLEIANEKLLKQYPEIENLNK